MRRKISKHRKKNLRAHKLIIKESLHPHKRTFYLNTEQIDRVSFSILKDENETIKEIQNVSYDMNIEGTWIGIVRYDDHSGTESLHKHTKVSLESDNEVAESIYWIKGNKEQQLTQACDDIRQNYKEFKDRFLKNSGLD